MSRLRSFFFAANRPLQDRLAALIASAVAAAVALTGIAAYAMTLLTAYNQLDNELVDVASLTSGTVYPLLSRLRKAGLVDTAWQESPVGPPRKYYTLTADGTVALAEMTGAWRSVVTAVDATIPASHPKGTAS